MTQTTSQCVFGLLNLDAPVESSHAENRICHRTPEVRRVGKQIERQKRERKEKLIDNRVSLINCVVLTYGSNTALCSRTTAQLHKSSSNEQLHRRMCLTCEMLAEESYATFTGMEESRLKA